MDWARAKNVLIAAFLILNMILLGVVAYNRTGKGIGVETINNTVEILSQNAVTIKCNIPVYEKEIASIDYESNELNRERIEERLMGEGHIRIVETERGEERMGGTKSLCFINHDTFIFTDKNPDTSVDIEDISKLESWIRDLIKSFDMNESSYILDKFKRNEDGKLTVLFTEEYKGFKVFDNYISVTISSEGINKIVCKHKRIKGFLNDSRKVMPAHKVLLKNFMSSDGTVITSIDIGFKGYESESDMKQSFEGPAWRIGVEGQKPLYYSAIDGTEIENTGN